MRDRAPRPARTLPPAFAARAVAALAVAALALAPAVAGDRGRDDDGLEFKAVLSGANEVPPADTRTRGEATFEVDEERTRIRYKLELHAKDRVGLLGVAGAHIHCAPAGENGPVVAFLSGAITGGIAGKFEIRATLTEANITNPACGATLPELVQAMLDGRTYVNAHSLARPSGEARGQIRLDDDDHGGAGHD